MATKIPHYRVKKVHDTFVMKVLSLPEGWEVGHTGPHYPVFDDQGRLRMEVTLEDEKIGRLSFTPFTRYYLIVRREGEIIYYLVRDRLDDERIVFQSSLHKALSGDINEEVQAALHSREECENWLLSNNLGDFENPAAYWDD